MKAIAFTHALPLTDPDALVLIDAPEPQPGPLDLLVAVQAVAVNPVDTKVRRAHATPGEARIGGWDAAGEVLAVGRAVRGFAVGDRVWYAGDLQRPGCFSERQAVDHRLVAHRPASLDADQAAALPLTSLTAWELLFDRLQVAPGGGAGDALLIVGAAGGVGSVLVQLARQLTGLTVIATAGRDASRDWVKPLGAHHVIDHRQPLSTQLAALGIPAVRYVACLTETEAHFAEVALSVAPQGRVALIDDPAALDIRALKRKSVSLHWEFMFTRVLFDTPDLARQGEILAEVTRLVDAGRLRTTVGEHLGVLGVETLRQAQRILESGQARGKLVLSGF